MLGLPELDDDDEGEPVRSLSSWAEADMRFFCSGLRTAAVARLKMLRA